MQRNFILTDVMKTGHHQDLEDFISMHTMPGQQFDMTGEYYTMHNYDLDSYDRRFAIIDYRKENIRVDANNEFMQELDRRCKLLHSQGFKFIKACPWESVHNLKEANVYQDWKKNSGHSGMASKEDIIKGNICNFSYSVHPQYEIDHVLWTGGVSWFWFFMYRKHLHNNFKFDHREKKFDFLFLNKESRDHRKKMLQKIPESLLDKSLWSNWPTKKLDKEYEIPWAVDYPRYGLDQDIYEKPYNASKFSLVSETNDNNNEIFMTEKIWKPILAQQPFIVHGNHLYLQKLREMGFKTFSSYFDESYDLESDPDMRIKKIIDLCVSLKQINWQDLYLQTQSLRKHNYDIFFNKEKLSFQVNSTLKSFLEFADSGQVTS